MSRPAAGPQRPVLPPPLPSPNAWLPSTTRHSQRLQVVQPLEAVGPQMLDAVVVKMPVWEGGTHHTGSHSPGPGGGGTQAVASGGRQRQEQAVAPAAQRLVSSDNLGSHSLQGWLTTGYTVLTAIEGKGMPQAPTKFSDRGLLSTEGEGCSSLRSCSPEPSWPDSVSRRTYESQQPTTPDNM